MTVHNIPQSKKIYHIWLKATIFVLMIFVNPNKKSEMIYCQLPMINKHNYVRTGLFDLYNKVGICLYG